MTIHQEIRLVRLENLIRQNTNVDMLKYLCKEHDELLEEIQSNKS